MPNYKGKKRKPSEVTLEEITELIEKLEPQYIWLKALTVILLYTRCHLNYILKIRLGDIYPEQDHISIYIKRRRGKGRFEHISYHLPLVKKYLVKFHEERKIIGKYPHYHRYRTDTVFPYTRDYVFKIISGNSDLSPDFIRMAGTSIKKGLETSIDSKHMEKYF